jgi:putative sigma-54 modulation protein
MDIHIYGENIRVTDALEEYARKKLSKLERYLPNITEVRLDLGRENHRKGEPQAVAQITVRHARGAILRAEERLNGEVQTALNQALEKMYRQISRFKSKQSRKGKERFSATLEEVEAAEAIPELDEVAEIEEMAEAVIARRKEVAATRLTEEEAIEQMELLGHTFFIFTNATTGALNVVYKRRDGDYGVLNPTEG